MQFASFEALNAACQDLPPGDMKAAEAVARRQDTLTKPQGSLGRLEEVVAWLARWQGRETPRLDRVKVIVFAGSHGVDRPGRFGLSARGHHADGRRISLRAGPRSTSSRALQGPSST